MRRRDGGPLAARRPWSSTHRVRSAKPSWPSRSCRHASSFDAHLGGQSAKQIADWYEVTLEEVKAALAFDEAHHPRRRTRAA